MTVSDEKAPLLSHVVLPVPAEALPVTATMASQGSRLATTALPWSGLTNKELIVLAQEPFWVQVRAVTFWGFWLCWLTLLVAAMAIVASTPRCSDRPDVNSTLVTETPGAAPRMSVLASLLMPR